MKRFTLLVMMILFVFGLVGCDLFGTKTTTELNPSSTNSSTTTSLTSSTSESSPFDLFITAADAMMTTTIYGYTYEKIQSIDGFEVYRETNITQIVSMDPLKAKIIQSKKSLQDSMTSSQFIEDTSIFYFVGTDTILVHNDNVLISDEIFTPPAWYYDFRSLLDEEVILNYTIDGNSLNVTISDAKAEVLFGEAVTNASLSITLIGTSVYHFSLSYVLNGFDFQTNHTFTFEPYSEDIMDEY